MQDLRAFLLNNFNVIKEKIGIACRKAGRNPQEVKLLGASKKQPPEKIAILHELGVKLFGENYVQEGEKKIKELKDLNIEWHFIGRLQTNKVKKAISLFSVIQTLDRIELAKEIQKRAEKLNKEVPVLIEVNIGKEETKAGVLPDQLEKFWEEVQKFDRIKVIGLMCLPPWKENPEEVRPYFAKMKELFEKLKPLAGKEFTELSMGTSGDFHIAIEEGATIVRIGESLFGKRPS
jgi:pyridoxal phosphate enzyme (YggS family)